MTHSAPHACRSISIETSGPAGSVAIGLGDQLIAERSFAATAGHGRDFLPIADELCREAGWRPGDLNECYVSIGPGSFTGLRVAVAFARHLALACGTRIVAVPTMESIAWNLAVANLFTHGPIAVFLEAKKGLVFAVRFEVEQGMIQSLDEPTIVNAAEYLTRAPRPQIVTGSGVAPNRQAIRDAGIEIAPESAWASHAQGIFALGRIRSKAGLFAEPTALTPLYIRRPEAEELWDKRQQSAAPPG